jgi:thiamine kinase
MLVASVEYERLRRVLGLCQQALGGTVGETEVIKNFGSGLTNKSYLVAINDKRYVLRLNAANSLDLGICRNREYHIHKQAHAEGLAPEIILFSAENEFLLTEYIEGKSFSAKDFSCPDQLAKIALFLSKIHQLEKVEPPLDLSKYIDHYFKHIIDHDLKSALLVYKDTVVQLLGEDELIPKSVCHNDLLADNFMLLDSGCLIALDWEYASVGNPLFDFSGVIESQLINAEGQSILLKVMAEDHGISLANLSSELRSQRIIYRYVELLWFAVQYGHAPESIMFGLIKQKQNELAEFIGE